MGIRQFATSLSVIYRTEHTNRISALVRHVLWQARKLRPSAPITRRLSRSMLTDDEPGGVISQVNMLGVYDFNNMNFVRLMLADGGLFVDVGANIGSYTLFASENANARVLSLEPNPSAFVKLSRNVSQNARSNVTAINCAASAQPGLLRMTDKGSDPTNRVVPSGLEAGTIEVAVETLDGLCATRGFVPRLIKIDVEGHEAEVLKGASACLDKTVACIIENGDRGLVIDIMTKHFMRGPFYYSLKRGCLSRQPQRLAEDPIYISRSFAEQFPEIRIDAE